MVVLLRLLVLVHGQVSDGRVRRRQDVLSEERILHPIRRTGHRLVDAGHVARLNGARRGRWLSVGGALARHVGRLDNILQREVQRAGRVHVSGIETWH